MSLFISLLTGILALTWRYLLSISNKKNLTPTDDAVVHFYYFQALKKTKGFKIAQDQQFIINPGTYRPQLFYKVLGFFFGFKGLKKYGHWVNPLVDALFSMVLFHFLLLISRKHLGLEFEKSLLVSFLATVFYILSPLMIFFEARAAHFTERLFSYTLGMYALFFTLVFLTTPGSQGMIFFALVVLFNLLVIFSSQFTIQAMIFLQLLLSLALQNVLPFLSVLLAVLLAFVLDRKWFITYVKAKHFHFQHYHRALKSKRTSLHYIYKKFWIRMLVYGLPYLLLLLFLNDLNILISVSILRYMFYYMVGSILVFILVYLPIFRPYGEAVRYLEYSTPFVLFFLVYFCITRNNLVPLAVLFTVNLLSYFHYASKFNAAVGEEESLLEVKDFLKRYPGKRILPIPFKLSYFLATYLENPLVASLVPRGEIDAISKGYGSPINDFKLIKKQYDFHWIVYKKGFDKTYDFSTMKIVFQNARYIVFEHEEYPGIKNR